MRAELILELVALKKKERLRVLHALARSVGAVITEDVNPEEAPDAPEAGPSVQLARPTDADFVAYTDGSTISNPGPGGWGVVVVPADEAQAIRELSGGKPGTTNNEMELRAVLAAIQAAPPGKHVRIYADSQYAINCAASWWKGWEKRGWKKGDGSEISNLALIQEIAAAQKGRVVTFEWVRGHAGNPGNERADRIAGHAAAEAAKAALALAPEKAKCSCAPGAPDPGCPVGVRVGNHGIGDEIDADAGQAPGTGPDQEVQVEEEVG